MKKKMMIVALLAAVGVMLGMSTTVAEERQTITVTWLLAEGSTIEAPFAGGPQTLPVETDGCTEATYQVDVYWYDEENKPKVDAVMADGLLEYQEDWGLLAHEATAPDKPWSFYSLVPNPDYCEPEEPVVPEEPVTPEEPTAPPVVTTVAPPKERVYDGYDTPEGELG
jgi:hypothetical protein